MVIQEKIINILHIYVVIKNIKAEDTKVDATKLEMSLEKKNYLSEKF